MDAKRAARWGGYYFLVSGAGALLGYGLVAAGLALALPETYDTWQATGSVLTTAETGATGFVVAAGGLLVRRFVKSWALFRTLTGAVGEETAETFDNERLKSEILSVLDDRLAEMQSSVRDLRRELPDDMPGDDL